MNWEIFLTTEYFGNTGENYIRSLLILAVLIVAFKIFQVLILHKLERVSKQTKTDIDDFLVELVGSVKPPFYFLLSIFISLRFLTLKAIISSVVDAAIFIIISLQIIIISQKVIDYAIEKIIKNTSETEEDEKEKEAIRMMGKVFKMVLWIVVFLMVLSNLGVNITSAIAGLGIGGIAIAMAAKDVLSDILASVSIFADAPFKVGQKIQVGKDVGVVQKVGIKTTRLKTSQGEELVIPNKDLASSRISNLKRMETRRVKAILGITYGTSSAKLKKIPEIIKEIVDKTKNVKFDRVHFATYGDFSLNFEVVYTVGSPDYDIFMDAQQEVNLAIYEKFEEERIEFAFPTQTIHLEKQQQQQ